MRLTSPPRPERLGRFLEAQARRVRPWVVDLPGAGQRRRGLLAVVLASVALVLRPWPPLLWLPGWCVGALLLWALVEVLIGLWNPRRWR